MQVQAERMVAGGAALARDDDGRVVLVEGALPGERVAVAADIVKPDLVRGRAIEVLEPSADRIEPPCPFVAHGCGGCGWQHIDVAAQAAYKRDIILDALRRIAHVELELEPTVALPSTGYRTTVRAVVTDARAAFRRMRSHDAVVVDHCLVAHPLVDDVLKRGRFPGVREIVVRAGAETGDRCVLPDPVYAPVDVPDDVRVGRAAYVDEIIEGKRFRISARSFFQVRPDGATALARLVRDAVGSNERVADLYSGVGLFAGVLDNPQSVIAVERDRFAVDDARVNLRGLPAKVVRCDVARMRPEPVDVVIADPSRAGLGKDGARAVLACDPERIVLVSCDAAALARDIALLVGADFSLTSVTLVDLFAHTPHVECVTVLDRGRAEVR